jgi:hypothetical protein
MTYLLGIVIATPLLPVIANGARTFRALVRELN